MRTGKLHFRQKQSSSLAVMALVVLVVLVLIGKSIGGVISFFRSPVGGGYSWDSKSSFNLAVEKPNNVAVLSFDPNQKQITILKIPNDTYFNLPFGRGQWRVGAIYNLGQTDNPPDGAQLLKDSLAKLVGLPMDGFLVDSSEKPLDQEIEGWRKNSFSILSFIKDTQTNMSSSDALRVYKAMAGVRADKITYLDIETSDLTESELLPDSTRVLGVDTINLDLFVRKNMADSSLENEGLSIGIYNATSHPGLGQAASRVITNMGGNVIFVTNSDNLLATSQVTGKNTLTLERMSEVFAPNCLKTKCVSNDPRVQSSRADVNIILGDDFFKKE